MSFCFFDLSNKGKGVDFSANSWCWHTTLKIIEKIGIIDSERLDFMSSQALWPEINEVEAKMIAKYIRDNYADKYPHDARVLYDLTIAYDKDDGTLYREAEYNKNYSAPIWWLIEFCEFCEKCRGFSVG